MDTKTCTKCATVKPLDEFHPQVRGKFGRRAACIECVRKQQRARAKVTREHRAEYQKKFKAEINPTYHKDYHYKKKYGISYCDYLQLVEDSGGKCNICGTVEPKGKNDRFHLDHCHDSDKIRGILCSHCNHALGLFKDNPKLLRKAAEYLEKAGY